MSVFDPIDEDWPQGKGAAEKADAIRDGRKDEDIQREAQVYRADRFYREKQTERWIMGAGHPLADRPLSLLWNRLPHPGAARMKQSTKAAIWERYHAGEPITNLAADYICGRYGVINALRDEARRRHRRMPDVCREPPE